MKFSPLSLLLATAMVLPVVSAGTPASPEVTDVSGDATRGALDVVSLWVDQGTAGSIDIVTFHLKVRDLSQVDPAKTNGDYSYQWLIRYQLPIGQRQFSYAITGVKEVNSISSLENVHSVTFDQDANTIHISFRKSGALLSGATISNFDVRTRLGTTNSPVLTDLGYEADRATSTRTYTIV